MENLIYILIGIAWVAYSLYSSRQKALQKQQSAGLPPRGPSQSSPLPIPGNQSGGKTLLEDIFRELTGESRPLPQVVQPVSPVETRQPIRKTETTGMDKGSSGYKFISTQTTDFPLNSSENDNYEQENLVKRIKNGSIPKNFDLREAVIFSELLNRKYF